MNRKITVAGYKDANGIEHTVSFVDTFDTIEEMNQFVSSILGTWDWSFLDSWEGV